MQRVKQATIHNWGIYVILLFVIMMAFVLRLINSEAFSFWTDEALTPLRASYAIQQILRNDVIIQGVVTKDTHPPFYYLVIHFLQQFFGETDFAYRFPSVLAGVLLVPVMYQFGRRLGGWNLGVLAAVLTAVNPLQVWYANEARMYTILVLLIALASFVLWQALTGAPLVRSLVLYLVLTGLAFYTHYTAVFLIAFQALFWVWLLWQNGQKKLIIGAVVVGLLAAIPLVPYTIPRLFTGAEANFYYVNPQTMFQDVVRFFNLGVTVNFNHPGIKLLNGLAFGLMLLGFYAAPTGKCRAFLLVYLLAVVIGLMAGSLLKPMYQGVRHIIAGSPAFILLVAWGVVFAWTQFQQKKNSKWIWALVGALGIFVVFAGPVVALNNLYNHPEIYAKDDFRALVHYIERHAGENDVVVYNNAILLPFHDHYQKRDDLEVTAVPRYPMPALPDDPNLAELAQNYDRIWLVSDPPADDRDDDKLVQTWLDRELIKVDQHREFSQNGIVESITYSTAVSAVDEMPADTNPLAVQWIDLPTLQGVHIDSKTPLDNSALWITLYWDAETMPSAKTRLKFVLQDDTGKAWFTTHKNLLAEREMNWPETGLVQIPYFLTLPPGLPPGTYTLFIQPVTDDDLAPLGELYPVTTIPFAGTNNQNAALLATIDNLHKDKQIRFDNGLQFTGWVMPDLEIRPGHALPLTLYWESSQPLDATNLRYELVILAEDGTEIRRQREPISPDWLTMWPSNTLVMTPTGIYISPETAPGRYQLRWQLWNQDTIIPGRTSMQPWSTDQVKWGEIEVVPWPLETDLPTDVIMSNAVFGSAIKLHGYTVAMPTSNQINLTLVWQAQEAVADNLFVFVHLIAEDGSIITQEDRVPGNMLRPTSGWREGEIITDTFTLTLPENAASGNYQIVIGFYNPDSGVRLPVTAKDEPQPHDQLTLTAVTLP